MSDKQDWKKRAKVAEVSLVEQRELIVDAMRVAGDYRRQNVVLERELKQLRESHGVQD